MTKKIIEEFEVERHRLPGLVIYDVSADDLDQLEKETLSVGEDFSFFLACSSTAITLTASLVAFNVPAGKMYDSFFLLDCLSYVGGLYFGYRWIMSRREVKGIVRKIKERGGPLGESGKELTPEYLQSQEPKPPDVSTSDAVKP